MLMHSSMRSVKGALGRATQRQPRLVERLVKNLKGVDGDVAKNAAKGQADLVKYKALNAKVIADAGAIPPLRPLSTSSKGREAEFARFALGNLSS
jgi:hypothetical protein